MFDCLTTFFQNREYHHNSHKTGFTKLKEKVTRQEQQISRLTDKVMEQSDIIDRLQEKTADLGRLERYFGREQVQSIVERSKALEWAEKENKRPKRVFDMSR